MNTQTFDSLCFLSRPATRGLLALTLLAAGSGRPARAQNVDFPAGLEFVNAKAAPYNAVGDGVHDDTNALQQAITENRGRTVYLPNGTYLLSNRLVGKGPDGKWRDGFRLMGQSEAGAVLRLKDNCPGYQDAAAPKAVAYTASSVYVETGDWRAVLGEGNEAYNNFLERFTIDTGAGNPGAIGLDYLGNNAAAVRHLTIRGAGYAGLSIARQWVGPCLVKNLTVQGFQYGIKAARSEYGTTLEHIALSGQTVAGIYNTDNILSLRDVTSVNAVPALVNTAGLGLVTLLDANCTGGAAGASALVSDGALLARNVTTAGYARALTYNGAAVAGATLAEYVSDAVPAPFGGSNKTLNLPVQETPEFHDNDPTHWANVLDYGAVRDNWENDFDGIQAALNSGKPVVYFPPGRYFVAGTLTVPATVRKVVAYGVAVAPSYNEFSDAANPRTMFRVQGASADPIIFSGINIEKLHASATHVGLIGWENATARPLVLQDLSVGQSKYVYRTLPGAGPLFVEDVVANAWELGAGQQTWARQLNLEGTFTPTKLRNTGGQLWVLGWKTEGQELVFDSQAGARSEILGGLCYPVGAVRPTEVFCRAADSQVSLAYASSAFNDANDYPTIVRETRGATTQTLNRNQVRGRGIGRVVPLYSSANVAAPLPVVLTRFEARRTGPRAAELAWATATEGNNAGFEVERSADGLAFARLATVPGAPGGSSAAPRAYTYLDDAPTNTALRYYRLRQVDASGGGSTYSPVRTVDFAAPLGARPAAEALALAVFPNPARGQAATLRATAPAAGPVRVRVLDALGRVLRRAELTAAAGDNRWPLALPAAAGLYLVEVEAAGYTSRLRLVVE